jgi:TRAP-type C4-dicarboxylate transport system permease small subunit
MPSAKVPSAPLRWFLVPPRVLLVTFLLALLSFAVCLLLGILGLVISAGVRGVHPNMTIAYRAIAFPAAVLGGAAALVAAIVMEIRHRRQQRNQMRSM